MLAFLHSDLFLRHLEGYDHVEHPDRLKAILNRVKKSRIAGAISFIEAEPAKRDWIERIHDRDYVDAILSLETDIPVALDWGDTVATSESPQAALHAAGAGVQAVRMVMGESFSSAFCAVRPPGHHAEKDRAMGFCIFNNIAIAAAYLLEETALHRVVIVDWDVHHGNGTEHAFIEDPRVLYISMHQYPHYPGTGHSDMTGKGDGVGFTLNIPMSVGAGDPEYLGAFGDLVVPAIDDFKPEFVLISAGFDGHLDDPLSGTRLSSSAYGEMTTSLRDCADRLCNGRIVSMLEGGYDLAALAESVEEHLAVLTA
jgi:acetoin utilization deacetylase AcuC-like enzyme